MATQGKIKTLYSDVNSEEALFPRTKTNAVSDQNGIGLDAILDKAVYTKSVNDNELNAAPVNADTLNGNNADYFASKSYVAVEIAKAKLEGEDVDIDLSGYATKDDLNNLATKNEVNAIDFPVDSVNGKTGAITLSASDVDAVPLTGNSIITGTWSDTPLKLKSAVTNKSYIGFQDKAGTDLGFYGFSTANTPAVYTNGSAKKVYYEDYKPTPADIGAAASSHTHSASNITSGTLSTDRLPTIPITKGGLGGTDRLTSAKNLTNEAVSSPGYVVSLTGSWKNFGYTTLQQLRNASGLGNTTGALPIANGGTGSSGASASSASNSHFYAHVAKFGNLVVCSLLLKCSKDTVIYESSVTIPSGYRPKSQIIFNPYSNQTAGAGGSATGVSVAARTSGELYIGGAHGYKASEVVGTYCWVSA